MKEHQCCGSGENFPEKLNSCGSVREHNFCGSGEISGETELLWEREPETSISTPDPFQELVDALRRALTPRPPSPAPAVTYVNTTTSPSPTVHASSMYKPAPYSGSAEDCSGFLLQCALVLEMQPHLYPNDTSKIAFIISQLQGKALQWADSLWSQKGPVVQSYDSFVTHFREVFGKPVSDSSIGEKLYKLKRGSMSVNEYALQFRTLAAPSGWNEQALITTYRQGLEPRVRLHLAAYEDSIGLECFIQLGLGDISHEIVTRISSVKPVP
ncbi:Retrotransposon-like protein 1 [Anabarilius grahami]|uniref:Retrotransposon-like protein 1 n=1 Tax=Anabarilius grahami TaxID=495550 RepID=A0A3N0XQ78_ANAGA|nr:Retrotransposon-like protein 1 [Anabarilius grahami]